MMNQREFRTCCLLLALGAFAALATPAQAKEDEGPPPQFKYKGGTEELKQGCDGNLEINPQNLTFRCEAGKIDIPYSAITKMQYRSDVTKKVQKMKVDWKVDPPTGNLILPTGKKNRFFTVIYRIEGVNRVVVLEVDPGIMRPYLAELDLRTDKRVEVQSWEEN